VSNIVWVIARLTNPLFRQCRVWFLGWVFGPSAKEYTEAVLQRLSHLLVTLWWLTWVFVIIPCHTRGAIPMGPSCPECDGQKVPMFFGTIVPACCAGKKSFPGQKSPAPQRSPGNCAICQIVSHTPNTPHAPPLLLYLHLQEVLEPLTPTGATHYLPIRPYLSRAPPLA